MDDKLKAAFDKVKAKTGFQPSSVRKTDKCDVSIRPIFKATLATKTRSQKGRKYNAAHRAKSAAWIAKKVAERQGKPSTVPLEAILGTYSEDFKYKHGIRPETQQTSLIACNTQIRDMATLPIRQPEPPPVIQVTAPVAVVKPPVQPMMQGQFTVQQAQRLGMPVVEYAQGYWKYKDCEWYLAAPEKA